jgi:plasmid stability protein
MANLTITLDEEVLKKARMRALAQGTSVNAILAEYLESYADQQTRQKEAIRALLAMSRKSKSGKGGRRWTRDELYER